jgi:hypothetical protein
VLSRESSRETTSNARLYAMSCRHVVRPHFDRLTLTLSTRATGRQLRSPPYFNPISFLLIVSRHIEEEERPLSSLCQEEEEKKTHSVSCIRLILLLQEKGPQSKCSSRTPAE